MAITTPSTKAPTDATPGSTRAPLLLRITALVLRALFLGTLIVLAVRVSLPQSETIWSIYDTPADLVRFALGLAVAVWILVQLLTPPKDTYAYRTWVYVGLVLTPLAVAAAVAVW